MNHCPIQLFKMQFFLRITFSSDNNSNIYKTVIAIIIARQIYFMNFRESEKSVVFDVPRREAEKIIVENYCFYSSWKPIEISPTNMIFSELVLLSLFQSMNI